jgi:radical SAM superfamily enzyme YgiQ (UPF0313 family)
MNALLIFPASPDVFFNLAHHLRVAGKKALVPPLGLLTLARLLPEDWGKRFIDLHARDATDEDLAWANIAFISVTAAHVQDKSALRIIKRLKAAGVKVVAGGTGFVPEDETFAEQQKLYHEVDHFILREAELTLPPFLEDLEKGEPKPLYTTDQWADVTQSPIPMYELLNFDDYAEMDIQLIRGCPYSCDFCVVPALMGRPGRAKKTEQFLAELQHLYDLGWRGFIEINDDNLIADLKFAKQDFLPALVEWQRAHDMPFKFHVCIDVRMGEDDELLELMYQSGFHSIFLGIENLDEECLTEVNKKVNITRNIEKIVERIHRAGILVYCGLMVGFDHDKPTVFKQMMEFVDRTGIIMPSLTKVNAVPGTELYRRLKAIGRIDHSVTPGVAYASNILDLPIGNTNLDKGYVELMEHLWKPKYFYQRVKTVLKILKNPIHTDKLTWTNLKILMRIVYFIGLFSKEAWQFWKLLFWTLFRRPRQLPVFFAVQPLGYGFRRRCEEVFDAAYRAKWEETPAVAAVEPKALPAAATPGQPGHQSSAMAEKHS